MLELSELRPCMVTYADPNKPTTSYRALFHGWAELEKPVIINDGEDVASYKAVNAIVEFEDGRVKSVLPDAIRFLDTLEVFEAYDWQSEKEE